MGLSHLFELYQRCLKGWGKVDPLVYRMGKGGVPEETRELQMALVGVIELAPVFVAMLKTLPHKPHVFLHAPEAEADGFDAWGRLVPRHWTTHPCHFENGEIHVVRDAAQQAERCAELIRQWKACGIPEAAITVAVPEQEALAILDHGLRDSGIPVRMAEGRPTSHSGVLQLLSAVAECLDSGGDAPLRYTALARLVRQPDVEKFFGYPAKSLDEYFRAHLPERLDNMPGGRDRERIDGVMLRARELARIGSDTFVADVTQLLLKIYGERRLNRHAPGDRLVIHSLEAVRNALDGLQSLPGNALRKFAPADLLRAAVEAAGNSAAPSPEEPDAVELAGWLEAATDESPAIIVTSVFEGSLPEGASMEPLLHDRLRERLGLPCRESRFARDQYTLWTVTESRREKGGIALIAPRRSAAGEPTRPSRLLVAGREAPALAARLMALSSAVKANPKPMPGGTGFQPSEPDPERMRRFRLFSPTSFRTYLASPRLFYFRHVLGLGDRGDDAQEMDGALFGTTLHAVLQAFGKIWMGKEARLSAAQIEAELESHLENHMQRSFGRHALPAVYTQQLALRGRLGMFAKHQAAAFEEGWRIAFVESGDSLVAPFRVEGAPEDVQLKGKIDRIDWHPDGRWRVIDYKSAARAVSPEKAHYSNKQGWKDLQLPLYLKLLPVVGPLQNGSVDLAKTELVYFNLPPEFDESGITAPFPADKIEEAWEKAESIVREICSGEGCREAGKLSQLDDPAFAALCGLNGLDIEDGEEEA